MGSTSVDSVAASPVWMTRPFATQTVEAATAVAEISAQIDGVSPGLLVLFVSSSCDLKSLAASLLATFPGVPMLGCTTAGEIGRFGYGAGGIAGVAFAAGDLRFELGLLEGLSTRDFRDIQKFAGDLRARLGAREGTLDAEDCFGFMLIDGLCGREESVARAFHDGLGGIPLLGGSAGDGLAFRQTFVLYQGRFVSDAAVLLLARSTRPFTVFKTQHFVCGSERMVVTGADPERRVVYEINGCPAAEEYSRVIGVAIDYLDPMVFAAFPVLVRIGDSDFVRSIQKVNPDGSLSFFCAIDEGIVFRVAEGVGMLENLEATMASIRQKIGKPRLILACDCILRNLEAERRGWKQRVGEVLADCNVVGFSTYGEQFRGMHVNQTLTGIAFSDRPTP